MIQKGTTMKINILYEDNHLLCVEKPVNVPVQEDDSKDLDLLTALKDFIKVRDEKPGNVFLALVHRLDRPVGGAMVFAKTSKAASRLATALQKGQFERSYLTVVRGKPQKMSGQLEDYLYKDFKTNTSIVVPPTKKGSKRASLSYRVLESAEGLSLIKVQLDTGRSHQIRVQFSHLGHPIWGDQRYGQEVNKVGQQIALWATDLTFKHPTKDEYVTIHSRPEAKQPWYLFSPQAFEK